MTIILGLFFSLVGLILLLSIIPIRIVATLNVKLCEKQSNGISRLWVGSKKFGLGFQFLPQRCVVFGPYNHPWFTIPIPARTRKTFHRWGTQRKKKRHKREFSSLIKLWRAGMAEFHWEYLAIKGRLELQNPMHTGLIMGGLSWISGMIPSSRVALMIQPYFSSQLNTDLKGQVRFRVQPARLAWRVGTTYFKYRK